MANNVSDRMPQAILFDLDGTLVDSAPDIAAALEETFKHLKRDIHEESKVRTWIGNGVNKLLHRALTNSMDGIAEDDEYAAAREIFFTEYLRLSGSRAKLYSEVKTTLEKFSQQNIAMACVTNKDRCFTIPLLEKLGIFEHFEIIVCGDDLTHKKPHPEALLFAAKSLNTDVKNCLMIGDSKSDVIAANEANIKVFCVDYGYAQGVNLDELKVHAMLTDIGQIEHYSNAVTYPLCG